MLLEHELVDRPNLYSIQNGSLSGMQYGYGSFGKIVHPFAGALGPECISLVDIDQ